MSKKEALKMIEDMTEVVIKYNKDTAKILKAKKK